MKVIIIILVLALFTTCSSVAGDAPAAPSPAPVADTGGAALVRDAEAAFQTDHLSYTLVTTPKGVEGEIAVVFTNRTGGPVFFVNCNGFPSLVMEQQLGDHWVLAWGPATQDCLSAPITVEPNQEYHAVVHVFGAHPGTNMAPTFPVETTPGVYRLVWHDVLRTYDPNAFPHHGEALPVEQRISNRFRIDVH